MRELSLDRAADAFAIDGQGGVAATGFFVDSATKFSGYWLKYWAADATEPRTANFAHQPSDFAEIGYFRTTDVAIAFGEGRLALAVMNEENWPAYKFRVRGALYDTSLAQVLAQNATDADLVGSVLNADWDGRTARTEILGVLPSSASFHVLARYEQPSSNSESAVVDFDLTADSAYQQTTPQCIYRTSETSQPEVLRGVALPSGTLVYSAPWSTQAALSTRPGTCLLDAQSTRIPEVPTVIYQARQDLELVLASSHKLYEIEVSASGGPKLLGAWSVPGTRCQRLPGNEDLVCAVDGELVRFARKDAFQSAKSVPLNVGEDCLNAAECESGVCDGTCRAAGLSSGSVCTQDTNCASLHCVANTCQ
jgi:hypothetical protein